MEIIAKELQLDQGHPDVHRLFLAVYKSFMEVLSLAIQNLFLFILLFLFTPLRMPWIMLNSHFPGKYWALVLFLPLTKSKMYGGFSIYYQASYMFMYSYVLVCINVCLYYYLHFSCHAYLEGYACTHSNKVTTVTY